MKKFLAFLFSSVLILGTNFSNTYATTDYQVYIAVFCKDKEKGRQLIDSLCYEKSELAFPADSKFTGEKNSEKNRTVIYAGDIDVNYHVKFELIGNNILKYEMQEKVDKCSGAIILYDISDKTLDPIVQSNTFRHKDLKRLMCTNTPLVNYIDKLQYSWTGIFRHFKGWYNAISFASYNKEKLDLENYNVRHEKINDFTCELESYYGVDNKWNRGHPDLCSENIHRKTLYWIAGQAYRSIEDGSIKGTYHPKKKSKISPKKEISPVDDDMELVLLESKDDTTESNGTLDSDSKKTKIFI